MRDSQTGHPSYFQRITNLYDLQQVQNDENDGKNDQDMDLTACLWNPWTDAPTEKAE
jgi:hypothetical protein